jgi:hypothetical protein
MEKKDFELAVDDFELADKKYKDLEKYFLEGEFLQELFEHSRGEPEKMKENYAIIRDELRAALEDRNAKLSQAQAAMRALVVQSPSQWRGPDGKATTIKYGPFMVMSKTRRGFDGKTLLKLATQKGFLDTLMNLEGVDDDGNKFKLVKQEISVNYQHVLTWLQERGMFDVIDGSYDESEMTPSVQGAKPLGFLGEKKDK